MGTSRAYVTKLMRGNVNFTLTTMVKLAMAVGGAVHVHISDQRAVTRWRDEEPGRKKKSGEPAKTKRAQVEAQKERRKVKR